MSNMKGVKILNHGKFSDVLDMLDDKGSVRTEKFFKEKFLKQCTGKSEDCNKGMSTGENRTHKREGLSEIMYIPDLLSYYDIKLDIRRKWRKIRHSDFYESAEYMIFNFDKNDMMKSAFLLVKDGARWCDEKDDNKVLVSATINKADDYVDAFEKCRALENISYEMENAVKESGNQGEYDIEEHSLTEEVMEIVDLCEKYIFAKFMGILAEVVSEFPAGKELYINIID